MTGLTPNNDGPMLAPRKLRLAKMVSRTRHRYIGCGCVTGLTPNNDGPMLVVLAPRKLLLAKMGAYTAQVYRVWLCDVFDFE